MAKKLSNPVADLISVPLQFNYNGGFQDGDGDQYYLNSQPVIPISLNRDWNLISRTILPIYSQDGVIPGEGSQFGLGDTTQSFFFSPKAPTQAGLIWGVGPFFLIPTATDRIATNQWGAGLTGVALVQRHSWAVGGLANHIWSFAGDEDAADVNATFLQPFLAMAFGRAMTLTIQSESQANWEASSGNEWSIPLNVILSKVATFGPFPASYGGGAGVYLESPSGGPEWKLRSFVTLLLPEREPVTATPPADEARGLRPGRGGRILLVEDNDEVGAFAEQLLGELGHDVVRVLSVMRQAGVGDIGIVAEPLEK